MVKSIFNKIAFHKILASMAVLRVLIVFPRNWKLVTYVRKSFWSRKLIKNYHLGGDLRNYYTVTSRLWILTLRDRGFECQNVYPSLFPILFCCDHFSFDDFLPKKIFPYLTLSSFSFSSSSAWSDISNKKN